MQTLRHTPPHVPSLAPSHTHTGRWREREREIKGERPISIHHLRKKTNGEMTLPRGRCLLPTVSHSQSSCVCTYLDALMCEFQLTCVCVCVSVNECVCREAALQVRTGRRPLQQREKRREEREAVTEEGWQERANRKTCCSFQIHFLLFSLSGAEDYLQHRDVKLWWTKSFRVCDCSQNWKPKTVSLKRE